jgi:glycine cleavage system protein P-like pyridoxal-binding family
MIEPTESEDRAELDATLGTIASPPGDVYDLERERGGRHAAIMRYGLNAAATD